jgi:hypothetical protein
MAETKQSKGGIARAAKLDSGEKRLIASLGGTAKKEKARTLEEAGELPKATHQGKMLVGDLDLDCYNLADGRRVFHKRGMAKALGMKSGGGNVFLRAVQRKGLGSEIKQKLLDKIETPIVFKPLTQDLAHGYEASVLVEICEAIIRAEQSEALHPTQAALVAQAKILLKAFAKVGVTALIDEATGFQQIRSPDALRMLVQQYIEEECREWEKQFPNEYYDELNRLYGSKRLTKTGSGAVIQNRPQHFAKFTRSYVYYPLENGKVLEELDRLNPKIDKKGTRKSRLHQHLKKGYGIAKLQRQVNEIITLVKVSDTVAQFRNLFSKRFRDSGPLFEDAEKK